MAKDEQSRKANPYIGLGSEAFWRSAIGDKNMFSISDLWEPKCAPTPEQSVSTYGSCFAQHIGRSLRDRGYQWLVTETAPDDMDETEATRFNYGIFSSRTGNIYTASLFKQWISWANGTSAPPSEIWEKDGRYFDPFRPVIEPNGFESAEEVTALRAHTIKKFNDSITQADFYVFTMGLTESWFNKAGYEYPMCPGTVAGEFDPDAHVFKNQNYDFILENMNAALDAAKAINPRLKFILTVSPVPLTATMSGKHVLVATMHSKSILRAVAGELAKERADTDYFPSYEIINSAPFGGVFFEANKRSVHPAGVQFVMDTFFRGINSLGAAQVSSPAGKVSTPAPGPAPKERVFAEMDQGCEEAMLDVYARGKK